MAITAVMALNICKRDEITPLTQIIYHYNPSYSSTITMNYVNQL